MPRTNSEGIHTHLYPGQDRTRVCFCLLMLWRLMIVSPGDESEPRLLTFLCGHQEVVNHSTPSCNGV